jgi:lactate permease
LRIWQPGEPLRAEATGRFERPAVAGAAVSDTTMEREIVRRDDTKKDPPLEVVRAYAPYLIIIAVFSIAQISAIKDWMAGSPWTTEFTSPGLDVRSPDGEPLTSLTYTFNWLPAAGTLMLISGPITMAVIGLGPGRAARVFGRTVDQLKWAIVTVAAVLALAYVMNQSG